MEKYKSKLRFDKYVVNEVNFKNNDNFKPQHEGRISNKSIRKCRRK